MAEKRSEDLGRMYRLLGRVNSHGGEGREETGEEKISAPQAFVEE
jgi:hypothetical protein